MEKMFAALAIALIIILALPRVADAHDDKLDVYGCHYEKNHKVYHCHQGMFKGGSFDSRTQMVQRLKIQFLNMGRPWPYPEIVEEDITSPMVEPKPES